MDNHIIESEPYKFEIEFDRGMSNCTKYDTTIISISLLNENYYNTKFIIKFFGLLEVKITELEKMKDAISNNCDFTLNLNNENEIKCENNKVKFILNLIEFSIPTEHCGELFDLIIKEAKEWDKIKC